MICGFQRKCNKKPQEATWDLTKAAWLWQHGQNKEGA